MAISSVQGQDDGWLLIPNNRNIEVGPGVELELEFSELIGIGRFELQQTLLYVDRQTLDGLRGAGAVHDLSDQRDAFGLRIEAEIHVKFVGLEQELASGSGATDSRLGRLQEGIEDQANALVSRHSQGHKLGFGYSYNVVRGTEPLFFASQMEDGAPKLDD